MMWNIFFLGVISILLTQVLGSKQTTVSEAPKIYSYIEEVTILTNLTNQSLTVGTNATVYGQTALVLICNASGYPPPYIRWKRNGKIVTINVFGNKLYLTPDPVKSGQYMCKAKNYMGIAKRSSFVKFIEPKQPAITLSRKKIFAINGENHVYLKIGDDLTTIAGTAVDIQCLASGIPKPRCTWYHNNKLSHNSHLINPEEENYFFNQAIPVNATGNYTCVAMNAYGSTKATSYIKVIESVFPFINSSEKDTVSYDMTRPLSKIIGGTLETLVGASILLKCPAYGIPSPEIKWEKDNRPITAGKRVRISMNQIDLLGTIMSDTGWYSCKASNGAGIVTKATFIHLIAPEMPRIIKAKSRYKYIVNNLPTPFSSKVGIELRILGHRQVTIYCSATGFPKPTLSWRKNARTITKKDNVSVSESGSKIVFKRLTEGQSGAYSCTASNAAGHDIARTSIITRLPVKPRIEITTTVSSKHKPARQRVNEVALTPPRLVRGSDIVLKCEAIDGYPPSKFTWFKDGKRLYFRTKERFNKSSLELKNLRTSDQGVYKCFASNNIGEHETTLVLTFEGTSAH